LLSGLFIDVGTNYSVLDHTNLSFLYEDVLTHGPNSEGVFVSSLSYFECYGLLHGVYTHSGIIIIYCE